ncbi:unnamed protein product, partial [Leptidea sinapis]
KCLIELPPSTKSLFRPPEDCNMCTGVTNVTRLQSISPEEFEEYFAYSTQPVIVTDATAGWKALQEFSFKFFVDFYSNVSSGRRINECFYFPYKSGLNSLAEVFSMDEARRPYFLPRTAESDIVDWIFMGGPGQGAHMHVDSVRHMSWQAQVRGTKQWELAPPPECLYSLVVDTNWWYHKTSVLPGDISITIGAEYD